MVIPLLSPSKQGLELDCLMQGYLKSHRVLGCALAMVGLGLVGSVTGQFMVPVRKRIQNSGFKIRYLFKGIHTNKGCVGGMGEGLKHELYYLHSKPASTFEGH